MAAAMEVESADVVRLLLQYLKENSLMDTYAKLQEVRTQHTHSLSHIHTPLARADLTARVGHTCGCRRRAWR
jgi:hypothetical protein